MLLTSLQFWICWQKELTESFHNAPVPMNDNMLPADLGISVDRTTLREVVDAKDDSSRFLAKNFDFAWKPSLLGMSTNFLGDMCYSANSIDSPSHRLFASLHDYLVDSTKNGYTFAEDDWRSFKARHTDPRLKIVSPAYKLATALPLIDSIGKPVIPKHKSENITDHLIFGVARTRALSYIQDSSNTPNTPSPGDAALTSFFISTFQSPNPVISALARTLRPSRDAIMRDYKTRLTCAQKGPHDQVRFFELAEEARLRATAAYTALLPSASQLDDPVVKAWMQQAVPGMPSLWTLLKASAAAALQPDFAWTVASDGICYLRAHAHKAGGGRGPVMVVPELFGVLKVGKVKSAADRRRLGGGGGEGKGAGVGDEKEAEVEGEGEDDAGIDVGRWNGSGIAGRNEHTEHTRDLDMREEVEEDGEFFDAHGSPMKMS